MKTLIILLSFILSIGFLPAQSNFGSGHAQYSPPKHQIPCITQLQRDQIQAELMASRAALQASGQLLTNRGGGNTPSFIWPVAQAEGFTYNQVYGISNFVDHNANFPNQLLDYNCGQRTYDLNSGYNHQGLDIYTWPFSWYQMENDQAIIVAAAPGTIIYKDSDNFDHNCDFSGDGIWNAVYIEHADGSIAWYGHMKMNSLTSKNIGATVAAGEFLGVIGSSGYSTGPHLHFEVYDSNGELMDPYVGPCNPYHSTHNPPYIAWENPRDYFQPNINAVLNHDAPPVFNDCPQTETLNLRSSFLPGEQVYNIIYLSDQVAGSQMHLNLSNTNGTELYDYDSAIFENNWSSSYWWWWFTFTEEQLGTYEFTCTYNDVTVATQFEIVSNLDTHENEPIEKQFVKIFPNPSSDFITVEYHGDIQKIEIFDMNGKWIKVTQEKTIGIQDLPTGKYILHIQTVEGKTFRPTFIKK